MQNNKAVVGWVLIGLGAVLLLARIIHVNLCLFFWPALLIFLGVWLLIRPQVTKDGTPVDLTLLGDVDRKPEGLLKSQEFWTLFGDIDLDFTKAEFPVGEIRLRIYGFIADTDIYVPQGVAVAVSALGFINEIKFLGKKQSTFIMPVSQSSDGYASAERKLMIETVFFISDLNVRQG